MSEFERHPEWGDLTQWDARIVGIERDFGRYRLGVARLGGLAPYNARIDVVAPPQQYRDSVSQVMAQLNRHPAWSKSVLSIHRADAYSVEGMELVRGAHIVFANAAFLDAASEELRKQLAALLPDTLVFATVLPATLEAFVQNETHELRTFLAPSGRIGFTVALPVKIYGTTGRQVTTLRSPDVDEPEAPPPPRDGPR